MTRDSVRALAGLPDTPSIIAKAEAEFPGLNSGAGQVEWFPTSGISVAFDSGGVAREINFKGNYGHATWIPSSRPIIGRLHLSDSFDGFVRELGLPVKVDTTFEYYTSVWRVGRYAVFGEFWLRDYVEKGKRYPAQSLRWLTTRPAVQ